MGCPERAENCARFNNDNVGECEECFDFHALNTLDLTCINCQGGEIPGCVECSFDDSVTGHMYTCDRCG